MMVGRFVAGLPFESQSFETLPTFFPNVDESIRQAARDVFPGVPPTVQGACLFLLASLVYRAVYLRQVLPHAHPLHSSVLIRGPEMLAALKHKTVRRCSCKTDTTRPPGIPTHIGILVAMASHAEQLTVLTASLIRSRP